MVYFEMTELNPLKFIRLVSEKFRTQSPIFSGYFQYITRISEMFETS